MEPRRAVLVALATLASSMVATPSLAAPTHLEHSQLLDGVLIDKETGQVTFALLIDWPLDGQGTMNAIQVKLNRYYRARKQGVHVTQFPQANPALPVKLHVFHLPAKSEQARDVLSKVDRSARRYGFSPTFESRVSIEGPAVPRS
jgi:hypothetical protein